MVAAPMNLENPIEATTQTQSHSAVKPQPKERRSVSRSAVATQDTLSLSEVRFQWEVLRVTNPRSNKFVQPAKTLMR
jgi:3-phenylpropionate/cinnamic acid dioxygenase small subunit